MTTISVLYNPIWQNGVALVKPFQLREASLPQENAIVHIISGVELDWLLQRMRLQLLAGTAF